MRKQIRIQKKIVRRRDEPQQDAKIPRQVNPRTKKKIEDAKEREKKIDDLIIEERELKKNIRELFLQIDEAMKQKTPAEWHVKYVPMARDCIGKPFDLRRQY